MPKANNKRTVIAVRFTPGEKQHTQVTDTGTILENFKEHCDSKGFQYSRKCIELCQDYTGNYSIGEELKTYVRKFGVGLYGLKIGPFIKVIITRYMNGLKPGEK